MAFDIYGRTIPDYFGTKQQGYDFDEQAQGYAGTPGARPLRGPSWFTGGQPQGGLTYAQPSRAPSAVSVASPAVRRAAPTTDYLGTAPTRQPDKELTDEDRAAMQERYYQFQISQNNPDTLRRQDEIGQAQVSNSIRSNYLASPQGKAMAFRDRQNSGQNGPTARGGDPRLTDPYGLNRAY